MNIRTLTIVRAIARVTLVAAVLIAPTAALAHEERVDGTITTRLDSGFIMQTFEGTPVTVALGEQTKIKVDDGPGRWDAAELIPGLRVKVEGTYNSEMALNANVIKFSKNDRKLALAIKAGLVPTNQQVARNSATIEQHGSQLGEHSQSLGVHQQQLNEHADKIVATTGAIAATNDRIARLDDFKVIDSFTVYFKNGQWKVGKAYLAPIAEFANKAKTVDGYKVAVEGFASAVGKPSLNDMLSAKRADAVTLVLQQSGAVPPANLMVPAALGTTQQVAENGTKAGQAKNRRVVISILQNKGIAEK